MASEKRILELGEYKITKLDEYAACLICTSPAWTKKNEVNIFDEEELVKLQEAIGNALKELRESGLIIRRTA